jgi:SAM-dependent methyltransferase
MPTPYQKDLAYVQATAFGDFARGAAVDIVSRLRHASGQVRTVVDAGCGAGILTGMLMEAGFDAIGIDSSAELLRYARRNAPKARLLHGSLYRLPLPECDALIAAGESLTYHSDVSAAADLVKGFFQSATKALRPGGMLKSPLRARFATPIPILSKLSDGRGSRDGP